MHYVGLWVDDTRPIPRQYQILGWIAARSYDEAIALLENNTFDTASLDHDIASYRPDGREMTGYDVAWWLVERHNAGHPVPRNISVHSANPVGVTRTRALIDRYLP